ncbi:ABC-type nitrate/sulfonate/bicarbonate transport system, ATPase component [Paenibacillus catalpae]|uniref:ABC-type nitrate/sulfonate/bicarbonate transport system, ATPase component n=1 Tax=Paenibacillus catalpae TaxID=1045775 RepID=A0A1I1UEF7_9BACL|nr:ABC transporter ATP-binding protein [Paenibacillus catalpae]SFD67143.1 ABC-type nitrate/sulfonate/bicarbonate transport system, ATPase component [Paenibacillus catalpae]
MTTPALELKGIHKEFDSGRKKVLNGLSLSVAESEFVSIIGPSGSGKTTLFQLIGGLEKPTAGEVWIGGKHTTGSRGHISYMPQQASLMPWRSVSANIELALEIAGIERKDAGRQAREWLDRIGLLEYADSYPHVLSGGMQQRVSFLRALLSPQPLMLLDEPFGALDALTRQQMQQWLMAIWEQNRRSVLLVTHSIEEALLLSDRIIVLSSAPAVILEEIPVPFARPRSPQLWREPLFNELKQHIHDLLH